MMRRALALALAGLALGACGHVSSASALHQWSQQSAFDSAVRTLRGDARHAATTLRSSSTLAQLHTVCAVLLVDVQAANAALPTPDAQTTRLLSRAYEDLGAGANRCYGATSGSRRQAALEALGRGAGELSEAQARVRSF